MTAIIILSCVVAVLLIADIILFIMLRRADSKIDEILNQVSAEKLAAYQDDVHAIQDSIHQQSIVIADNEERLKKYATLLDAVKTDLKDPQVLADFFNELGKAGIK
jgi:hypothetical protein